MRYQRTHRSNTETWSLQTYFTDSKDSQRLIYWFPAGNNLLFYVPFNFHSLLYSTKKNLNCAKKKSECFTCFPAQ